LRNDPLRDALRRLPAEKASTGFTARTLARLDTPHPQATMWRLAPVAAVLLMAAVALPAGWHYLNNPGPNLEQASRSVPATPPMGRADGPGPTLPATAGSFTDTVTRPAHLDERARALQELAALQEEQQRLHEQWREYRRLARAAQPVLYLGGNDKVDIVFDLRRVPPAALTGDVVPAAMTNRSTDR
jgi:hypothetical protein